MATTSRSTSTSATSARRQHGHVSLGTACRRAAAGQMDFATLLDGGDFGPTEQNLVRQLVRRQPAQDLAKDGSFENATSPGNLVTDPDFESTLAAELCRTALRGGSTGNLLAKRRLRGRRRPGQRRLRVHGGTTAGWNLSTGFSASMSGDTAPAKDAGRWVTLGQRGNGRHHGERRVVPEDPLGPAVRHLVQRSPAGSAPTRRHHLVRRPVTQTGCSWGNVTTRRRSRSPATGRRRRSRRPRRRAAPD